MDIQIAVVWISDMDFILWNSFWNSIFIFKKEKLYILEVELVGNRQSWLSAGGFERKTLHVCASSCDTQPCWGHSKVKASRPGQGTKQTSSNLPSLAVRLLAMEKTQTSVVKSETFGCAGTCAAEAGRPPEFESSLLSRTARVTQRPYLEKPTLKDLYLFSLMCRHLAGHPLWILCLPPHQMLAHLEWSSCLFWKIFVEYLRFTPLKT